MQAKDVTKILLVDDETALTEPLSRALRHEGYTVDVAHEGQTGIQLAIAGDYRLYILDWMLPQQSGLKICQQLRQAGRLTPVLLLTAKDTLDDRVAGLDAGADDYLVKPFELRELLARVRALLRRQVPLSHPASVDSTLSPASHWQLDSDNQVVYRGDKAILLSEKEVELLQLFLAEPGQLLPHAQIYAALWPSDDPPNSNVLAALVRLLRRKLEQPGDAKLIQSVYGKGYRFDPDAET